MAPTKKKKKKGGKKPKSPKGQEQTEQEIDPFELEIRELQEKLANIHAAREGENERIEKGTGKTAVQRMQLMYFQSKIERVEEEFLTQKDLVEAENMVEESEAQHKVDVLDQEVKRLETAHAHFQNLQERSKEMDVKIQELLATMAEMDEKHALEVHSIKKEMLDFRRQLEHNFRKMLMDKDIEFQRQAFQSLSGDKKEALLANAKLKEEMTLQSIGLENLGQRAGAQNLELSHVKESTENLQQQSKEYHVEAALLRKQMRANDKLMKEMQESIRSIAEEEGQLVNVVMENTDELHPLEEVQAELQDFQSRIRQCESEIERWKARALEFTSQISGGKIINPEDSKYDQKGALELAKRMIQTWEKEDARNPFRDAIWFSHIEPQLSVGSSSAQKGGQGLIQRQLSMSKSKSAGSIPNARPAKQRQRRRVQLQMQTYPQRRVPRKSLAAPNRLAGRASSRTILPQHQDQQRGNRGVLPHSKTEDVLNNIEKRKGISRGNSASSSMGNTIKSSDLVGNIKGTVNAEDSVSAFQYHRRVSHMMKC